MTQSKTILLAEDSPHDVELTLIALKQSKLSNEVVVVRDGVEALDYHLWFMRLLHHRRAAHEKKRSPLLLLSRHAQHERRFCPIFEMVEARGIEPLSLTDQPAATTCLVKRELSAMR